MIVDGKKIAEEIIETLLTERVALPPVLRLGVLMGAEDAASVSFVKIKERVADQLHVVVVREFLNANSTTADAERALERLLNTCEGVIVQLPLPAAIDIERILTAIPADKDVDAINPDTAESRVLPPVAAAIAEVFARYGISGKQKKAVVVGAGRLVGAPAAQLLADIGAEVSIITHDEGSLTNLKEADIVVLGAGAPGIVTPAMLKEGVVLIDAGTSGVPAGGGVAAKIVGDASPECAEVASICTPVPGGIGPIAVAMLFKNFFTLAKLAKN